jgi:hypothetical protein
VEQSSTSLRFQLEPGSWDLGKNFRSDLGETRRLQYWYANKCRDAFQIHVARVVFTIGEEQDKISGGGMIRSTFRSSDGPLKSGKQTALPTFQQPLLLECYKSSTELSLHLEFVSAHPSFCYAYRCQPWRCLYLELLRISPDHSAAVMPLLFRKDVPQGLKPECSLEFFTARLKSCPDTKHKGRDSGKTGSFTHTLEPLRCLLSNRLRRTQMRREMTSPHKSRKAYLGG